MGPSQVLRGGWRGKCNHRIVWGGLTGTWGGFGGFRRERKWTLLPCLGFTLGGCLSESWRVNLDTLTEICVGIHSSTPARKWENGFAKSIGLRWFRCHEAGCEGVGLLAYADA